MGDAEAAWIVPCLIFLLPLVSGLAASEPQTKGAGHE